ncbi:hypothetical protein PENTCL1PPCAC_10053, partial [Pristionchus entomophagus]
KVLSEYEWDPIDIRTLEQIYYNHERIFDLCGVCLPIVQFHETHSTRHSEGIQQVELQMSILPEILPISLSLLFVICVIDEIIGWHHRKIIDL